MRNERTSSHRRSGSELVPLEFEFGEHGATVKVIELSQPEDDSPSHRPPPHAASTQVKDKDEAVGEVAGVLPHLPKDLISSVLAKVKWNVEAAINRLLSVEEALEDNAHADEADEADEALAGDLVSANCFTEAEPFFHLNWLPKYVSPHLAFSLRCPMR
jgi:hypothetical protein